MNNVFISKTKSFYNYISSTHCKDFKEAWDKYIRYNNEYRLSTSIGILGSYKNRNKMVQSLKELYSVLRNNEYIAIRNYIFKEYSEEEEFENWVKVLKNFADFIYYFADPLFFNVVDGKLFTVTKSNSTTKFNYSSDRFNFNISFEKSKIKNSSSTLFDAITGLDKENTLSFIKIEITNKSSGAEYSYKYMEDSSLINENGLEDDICDLQLKTIKKELDNNMYLYIGIIFDSIINYELNSLNFHIFNSYKIKNSNLKELEEKWLENMNMESD